MGGSVRAPPELLEGCTRSGLLLRWLAGRSCGVSDGVLEPAERELAGAELTPCATVTSPPHQVGRASSWASAASIHCSLRQPSGDGITLRP